MASGAQLPPRPAASDERRFPEACQPGAARLPEPSARRSPRLAARTPRAAGPAADATPAPPPPSLGPERRLVPCDLEGLLDERRMAAHLKLALSREARLWRGGRAWEEGLCGSRNSALDGKRARGGGYIAEPLGDRRRLVPAI
nr:PREDICTED: cyclin-I2-like [Rhinolophus sinicus]